MARVRRILERARRCPFDRFNRLAHFEDPTGRTLDSLLDEFTALRRDNLQRPRALRFTDVDLERPWHSIRILARSRSASCWRRG